MSDTLTDIRDATESLCDPRSNSEPRWEWDASRHRKALPPHRTVVPGLIQQLRDLAEPGVDGEQGGRGGPESVPVQLDAVSLLAAISFGVRKRALDWNVDLTRRPTVEDEVRGLLGAAARRSHDDQRVLRSELRSWVWQAEVVAEWRVPPRELPAPCPVAACGQRGTLVAYPDPANPTARCVGCGTKWATANEVAILAQHVQAYAQRAQQRRELARTAAVAERRRRAGQVAA